MQAVNYAGEASNWLDLLYNTVCEVSHSQR